MLLFCIGVHGKPLVEWSRDISDVAGNRHDGLEALMQQVLFVIISV